MLQHCPVRRPNICIHTVGFEPFFGVEHRVILAVSCAEGGWVCVTGEPTEVTVVGIGVDYKGVPSGLEYTLDLLHARRPLVPKK